MDMLHKFGPLLGRILIAFIFLFSGIGKVMGFDGTVAYIAAKSLPLPQLLTIGAIIVELGGGVMLVLGWKARWAAAALFVFTGLAALFFHNFWAVPPEQTQNQMVHFMKNVAMMGGILFVVVHGSGPFSLDKGK